MNGVCEAVVRQIDVGLVVCRRDVGGLIVEGANPWVERLVGGSIGAGAALRESLPGALVQRIETLAKTGDVAREEPVAIRGGDGGETQLSLQVFPLDGELVGIALEDITAQVRDRAALAETQHHLAEAQSVAHIGSWQWRVQQDVVSWSKELYRIFGHEPGAIVSLDDYLRQVHQDDRERVRKDIERALNKDSSFDHIHRIVRHDGDVRVLHSRGRLIRAGAETPLMVGTCHDVTELHLREDELRRSEEAYRRLFEYDLTGDFMAARDGTIVAVNESFARMFRFESARDAAGTRLIELFPSTEAYDSLYERVVQRRRIHDVELELRRRDGAPVKVLGNFVAERGDDDELLQIIGYMVDVTERKQLEEQLRQMQKLDAIGRLAGGMAHDFNNMLTIILNFAAMLRRRVASDPQASSSVDAIEESARSAGALTRQLLTFARGHVGEVRDIELNVTLRRMQRMTRRLVGEDVDVVMRLSEQPLWIHADPGHIEQVVLNLAANARDAMPNGGRFTVDTGQVAITAGASSPYPGVPAGRYARIRVRDTGTGIAPEVRERMFEPFFTTKAPGEGTGLGLSTVFGIVTQAHGRIVVDSAPGAGATFTLLWPVSDRATHAAAKPVSVEPRRGSETVLLVEDSARLRRLISSLLEENGYRVLVASNANAALEQVANASVDVLLSDIVMPGMSGVELSARVRERCPHVRIIYMSGYSTHQAVHAGAVESGAAFLAKPFTPDGLLAKVRAALDASGA